MIPRALTALVLVTVTSVRPAGQELPGWSVVETDHFRFHFSPQAHVEHATFTKKEERAFDELRKTFEGALPGKIDFHVWSTSAEAQPLLGRPLGFSEPRLLQIHATASQSPGHELTHVLVFHTVRPEKITRFIAEGVAVAFDLVPRDRLAVARSILRRNAIRSVSVAALWEQTTALSDDVMYPIAGAFVERLAIRGGNARLLRLLKTQTLTEARAIYGTDLDGIIREFETELSRASSDAQLEALRAAAQQRMRRDRATYSSDDFRDIEALYQSANQNLRAPGARATLVQLIRNYPGSNRAGCAVLYLAQTSDPVEREEYLKQAIARHSDAMYGDGVQVGAFARAQLATLYASLGRTADAQKIAEELRTLFPTAVDHDGTRLVDALQRMKLLQ